MGSPRSSCLFQYGDLPKPAFYWRLFGTSPLSWLYRHYHCALVRNLHPLYNKAWVSRAKLIVAFPAGSWLPSLLLVLYLQNSSPIMAGQPLRWPALPPLTDRYTWLAPTPRCIWPKNWMMLLGCFPVPCWSPRSRIISPPLPCLVRSPASLLPVLRKLALSHWHLPARSYSDVLSWRFWLNLKYSYGSTIYRNPTERNKVCSRDEGAYCSNTHYPNGLRCQPSYNKLQTAMVSPNGHDFSSSRWNTQAKAGLGHLLVIRLSHGAPGLNTWALSLKCEYRFTFLETIKLTRNKAL